MLQILVLAAILWGVAAALRVPVALRAGILALLWLAIVISHLVLPQGADLRLLSGGRVEPWFLLAGLAALALGYRALLRKIRAKAAPAPAAAPQTGPFSEAELSRYARHLMLREVGGMGQRRLKEAKVLVVGAGGLGSPVLLYLAASGVGEIWVIDNDTVDASNLQRQIIHTDDRIGLPKVRSAETALRALNPFVKVIGVDRRLDEVIARELIGEVDLVLDGTDNFATRYLVNRICVEKGKPLIAAAITQWEGQISLYHPASGAPCFACIFPTEPAAGLVPSCAEAGVISPLPGVIGSMMALEAVKALTKAGESSAGWLTIFDGLYGETRRIKICRDKDCAVCGPAG